MVATIRSNFNQVFNQSPPVLFAVGGLLSFALRNYFKDNLGYVIAGILFGNSAICYFMGKNVTRSNPIITPPNIHAVDPNSVSSVLNLQQKISQRTDVDGIQFVSAKGVPTSVSAQVMQLLPKSLPILDLGRCQPVQELGTLVHTFPKNLQQLRVTAREEVSVEHVFRQIPSTCPNLRRLIVVQQKSGSCGVMDLNGMQHLKSLEQLILEGLSFTEKQLSKLPPQLREIRMSTAVDSQPKAASILAAVNGLKKQKPSLRILDLHGLPWQLHLTTTEPTRAYTGPMTPMGGSIHSLNTSIPKSPYANASSLTSR
ncbi:MAG TPA: hypothetical protein VLG44_01070 [Chlamydiales bacterium]|nr:hypothetical protein [Chlamydiales bacterium]